MKNKKDSHYWFWISMLGVLVTRGQAAYWGGGFYLPQKTWPVVILAVLSWVFVFIGYIFLFKMIKSKWTK